MLYHSCHNSSLHIYIYDLNILHYIIDNFIHLYIINTINIDNTVLDTQKKNTLHTYTHYHQTLKKTCNNKKNRKKNNNNNNFIYWWYTIIIYFARVFIIIDIPNTMNIFGYMTTISIYFQEIFIILQFNFWYFVHWEKKTKTKKTLVINRSNIICTFLYIDLKIWKLIPTYGNLVYTKINVEPWYFSFREGWYTISS
jgi:hypothetical protein